MENKKMSLWKQSKPYLQYHYCLWPNPNQGNDQYHCQWSGNKCGCRGGCSHWWFFGRDLCDWTPIKLFAGLSVYNSHSTFFRAFENSDCR